MFSDISNAESESDVDDIGLTVVQKSTDHSLLTPVHEEVCIMLIFEFQSLFILTWINFYVSSFCNIVYQ
jgi:hypothetical protein